MLKWLKNNFAYFGEGPPSNTTDKVNLVDRLFTKAENLHKTGWSPYAQNLPIEDICYLGASFPSRAHDLEGHLLAKFSVFRCSTEREARNFLNRCAPCKTAILVNLDTLDWPDGTLDFLIDIRTKLPSLVVVLGSSDLKKDDFSSDRHPICDASVKLPTTRTVFALALSSACQNNNNS